jgi:hypothetical protein
MRSGMPEVKILRRRKSLPEAIRQYKEWETFLQGGEFEKYYKSDEDRWPTDWMSRNVKIKKDR